MPSDNPVCNVIVCIRVFLWSTDKNGQSQDLMGKVQLESSDESSDEDGDEEDDREGEDEGMKERANGEAGRLDADAGMMLSRLLSSLFTIIWC